MGIFKALGKIFGKGKVQNKGTFHDDSETVSTPFGRVRISGAEKDRLRKSKAEIEREEEDYARRMGEEVEERFEEDYAQRMAEEAGERLGTPDDQFVNMGVVAQINGSQHVQFMQYLKEESTLYIGYHTNNSIYAYFDISPEEARGYYQLITTGTPNVGTSVVWKQLRQKGTAFGYQKDYTLVTGASPMYKGTSTWESEHMGIPPSGMIPDTWKSAKKGGSEEGPYGERETPYYPGWY